MVASASPKSEVDSKSVGELNSSIPVGIPSLESIDLITNEQKHKSERIDVSNSAELDMENDNKKTSFIDDNKTSVIDDNSKLDIADHQGFIVKKTSNIDNTKTSVIDNKLTSDNLLTSNVDNNIISDKDKKTSHIDDIETSITDDKRTSFNPDNNDIKTLDIPEKYDTNIEEHKPTDIDATVQSKVDGVDNEQKMISTDCDNTTSNINVSASTSDNECSNHSKYHDEDYDDDDETNVSQPTTALSDRSIDLDDDNSFDRFTTIPKKHRSLSNHCDDADSVDPLDENTKSSDMILYRQTSIRHRRQSIWMKDYDTSTASSSKTPMLRQNISSSCSSESRKNVRLYFSRQATRSTEPNRFKPLSNEAYLNRLPSDVSDFSNDYDSNDDHSYQGGNVRRFHERRRIATRRQVIRHGIDLVPCRVVLRRLSMSLIAKTDAKLKMEPKILLERCDEQPISYSTSSPICRRREIGQQYYGDRFIVDESSDENEPLVKLQTKKRKSIDVEWKPTSCPKSKKTCYLSDEDLANDQNDTEEPGWWFDLGVGYL